MRLHDLKPAPGSKHRKKRVGRGNANKGKTSGRGQKGQKARNSVHPWFEGGQMPLQRRLPEVGRVHEPQPRRVRGGQRRPGSKTYSKPAQS